MAAKFYLFQGGSTIGNFAELFALLFVFVLILVLAYYTSKWVGKTGTGMSTKNHNITIIETLRLSQTKYLQIIKVANKYIVIAVSKDHVDFLTEIDGDQLNCFEDVTEAPSFKEILSKIKLGVNVKSKDSKDNEKDENDV